MYNIDVYTFTYCTIDFLKYKIWFCVIKILNMFKYVTKETKIKTDITIFLHYVLEIIHKLTMIFYWNFKI